jgi:hypothetical protein
MSLSCPRCPGKLVQGVYLAQTFNKLRPGQSVGTLYPCGPGVMKPCLKCPECGFSTTEGLDGAKGAS